MSAFVYVLVIESTSPTPRFYVSPGKWSLEYPDAWKTRSAPMARAQKKVIERGDKAPALIRVIGDWGLNSEIEL